MKDRLVRRLKQFHPIKVKNALFGMGYYWRRPPPLNVEALTMGLPRIVLVQLVNYLEGYERVKMRFCEFTGDGTYFWDEVGYKKKCEHIGIMDNCL